MARTNRLPLLIAAVLAGAGASCRQLGPTPSRGFADSAPATRPAAESESPAPAVRAAVDLPGPAPRPEAELVSLAAMVNLQPLPAPAAPLPGERVAWREARRWRAVPPGLTPFLADVESRLPMDLGLRYRASSRVTWCHETTHGVQASLRNLYGLPAFYPGGGKCALVEPPAVTLTEVAAVVPPQLRGNRYQLYLVSQRRDWDREPLYVWDEWVAYDNGTTTGIEEGGRSQAGPSDDAVACIELSGYSLAVAAAARRKGAPVGEQFREFLAWELRRSLRLYARAVALPAFSWPDRRLERNWRGGDAFVAEELRALYGEALTVRDLLP
jgi:hypothetical protein